MPVDNQLYDRQEDIWWSEDQPLSMLRTMLNPVRLRFFQDQLTNTKGRRALDVGCGGGLLTEEVAKLGLMVTGVDPAQGSLATARQHAARRDLAIDYVAGAGEQLPFADASHDIVLCCDVLEHVDTPSTVVGEIARVLRPNGIFFYDTINRTLTSRVAVIGIFQQWSATSCAPANLHDWNKFIKPGELLEMMAQHGLRNRVLRGMQPAANFIDLIRQMRKRKRGEISYGELGRRMAMRLTGDFSICYIGWAIKN